VGKSSALEYKSGNISETRMQIEEKATMDEQIKLRTSGFVRTFIRSIETKTH